MTIKIYNIEYPLYEIFCLHGHSQDRTVTILNCYHAHLPKLLILLTNERVSNILEQSLV